MILTKPAILEYIGKGAIIAEPDMVQENSVNVRLGRDMWVPKPDSHGVVDLHDDRTWVKESPRLESSMEDGSYEYFILEPNQFYLGTTHEHIGTKIVDDIYIVPEMKARSTTGRHGITVAMCAGMGDIGYRSRWALEIKNNSNNRLKIRVGTEIAQVVFYLATPTDLEYGGNERYQLDRGNVRFLPKPFEIPYEFITKYEQGEVP